jgi:hypothetical protein
MIAYEYECWKCEEWHHGTVETEQELKEIAEMIGVAVRLLTP